jgi:adenylyltransferase/sulfurtransferase
VSGATPAPDGRFARFELVSWWDQERLKAARVLIVGAGALGNEVVKNLALLGVGQIVVADFDTVEISNLTRSALFRERDRGRPKADVVCAAARDLYPELHAVSLRCDIRHQAGIGLFRWADIVVGALDNREARLAINRFCALAGKPWVDGGLDVLTGIVRVFEPGESPCYECTMSEADWQLLSQRRACSLLPRESRPQDRPTPTTPTTASVIGGMQAAEVVKLLHGIPGLAGSGWHFDGAGYDSYRVTYVRDPDCGGHERLPEVVVLTARSADLTVGALQDEAARRLGPGARLTTYRELVGGLQCGACGADTPCACALEALAVDGAICAQCGKPAAPLLYHRLEDAPGGRVASVESLGLPPWDVVVASVGDRSLAFEFGGDRPFVLGSDGEEH